MRKRMGQQERDSSSGSRREAGVKRGNEIRTKRSRVQAEDDAAASADTALPQPLSLPHIRMAHLHGRR